MDDFPHDDGGVDILDTANPANSGGPADHSPPADPLPEAAWPSTPWDCVAALDRFLELCPEFPQFPAPWAWLCPPRDIRRTVAEPAAMVERLRNEFSDQVLLDSQLITLDAVGLPSLNRVVCSDQGFLFPVRESAGGPITDIVSPRGLLSAADTPLCSVPILPAQPVSMSDMEIVFGVVHPHEMAILHALRIPAVQLRGVRAQSAYNALGQFQVTAVRGCRELVEDGNAASAVSAGPLLYDSSGFDGMDSQKILVVMGFSFLASAWSVPRRIRGLMWYTREMRKVLQVDLSDRFLVLAPDRDLLHALYKRMLLQDAELVRDWFLTSALMGFESCRDFENWIFRDGVEQSYDEVRCELLWVLSESTTSPSYTADNLMRLHDELVAAVDRELIDPQFERAALSGDVVRTLPERMLATDFRTWLILQPYATAGYVPRQVRLAIDLGGINVTEYFARLTDRLHKSVRSNLVGRKRWS